MGAQHNSIPGMSLTEIARVCSDNLCRAVAIIADIKLMEKNNDMRLRAFICYGMNVQSLHRWMQVRANPSIHQSTIVAAYRITLHQSSTVATHCTYSLLLAAAGCALVPVRVTTSLPGDAL